jgi:parallel beta-helix repeat protein
MMTKINASNNSFSGIKLSYSSSNAIKDSVLQNNGILVEESYNNNVINTTVNGKLLVYLENEKNRVVDNAGQVILVNCRNVTVKDLDLSNATVGVEIWNSELIRVENVTARNNWFGIALVFSNNTIITNVTATNNKGEFLSGVGVSLEHSNNNTIANVTASNNGGEESISAIQAITGSYC